jgi:hypothetical protein
MTPAIRMHGLYTAISTQGGGGAALCTDRPEILFYSGGGGVMV